MGDTRRSSHGGGKCIFGFCLLFLVFVLFLGFLDTLIVHTGVQSGSVVRAPETLLA